MITVYYLPDDTAQIFGKGMGREHEFKSAELFYQWVKGYVCNGCLEDAQKHSGNSELTLSDVLVWAVGVRLK